jgi:predicted AAA+ superfamily ATPase
MYKRHLAQRLKEALQDTPVTLMVGTRQSSKSTLIKQEFHDYFSLANNRSRKPSGGKRASISS